MPWPETWSSRSGWVLACPTVTAEMYAEYFQTCMLVTKKNVSIHQDNYTERERIYTVVQNVESAALPALTVGKGQEKSVSATTDVDWG